MLIDKDLLYVFEIDISYTLWTFLEALVSRRVDLFPRRYMQFLTPVVLGSANLVAFFEVSTYKKSANSRKMRKKIGNWKCSRFSRPLQVLFVLFYISRTPSATGQNPIRRTKTFSIYSLFRIAVKQSSPKPWNVFVRIKIRNFWQFIKEADEGSLSLIFIWADSPPHEFEIGMSGLSSWIWNWYEWTLLMNLKLVRMDSPPHFLLWHTDKGTGGGWRKKNRKNPHCLDNATRRGKDCYGASGKRMEKIDCSGARLCHRFQSRLCRSQSSFWRFLEELDDLHNKWKSFCKKEKLGSR